MGSQPLGHSGTGGENDNGEEGGADGSGVTWGERSTRAARIVPLGAGLRDERRRIARMLGTRLSLGWG